MGELKLNQSDAVEAGAGNATGIVGTTLTGTLAPVKVSQTGAVTGTGGAATGISLLGAVTSSNVVADSVTVTVPKPTVTVGTKKTTVTTTVTTVTNSVTGDVAISQSGEVKGTGGAANAISLAGVTGGSGVGLTQSGDVTGRTDAYGINVSGAINSSNGTVSVRTSVDSNGTALATPKTVTATTGTAYGINLAGAVSTGVRGSSDALSITIEQNAAVTASAGSATGLNLQGDLMSGGNQTITQSGTVTGSASSVDIVAVGKIKVANGQGTLSFTARNGIDAKGAVITAGTVSAFSGVAAVGATPAAPAGAVLVNNSGNVIANFGAISAGSFDIGSSMEFNLTGNLIKTSTASGSLMKVSNYAKDKGIGVKTAGITATGFKFNL